MARPFHSIYSHDFLRVAVTVPFVRVAGLIVNANARQLLLLSLAACLMGCCQAQQGAVKVTSSPRVPAEVKQTPTGYRSRFCGFCKLSRERRILYFHLYGQPQIMNSNGGIAPRTYVLDVFEATSPKKKVSRINSIRFNYGNYDFSSVKADLMWVDPKRKALPVLRLHLFGGGFIGDFGSYTLVNFPRGFSQKATVQEYQDGNTNISSSEIKFNGVDKRGFVIVTEIYGQQYSGPYRTEHLWSGDRFGSPTARILNK